MAVAIIPVRGSESLEFDGAFCESSSPAGTARESSRNLAVPVFRDRNPSHLSKIGGRPAHSDGRSWISLLRFIGSPVPVPMWNA